MANDSHGVGFLLQFAAGARPDAATIAQALSESVIRRPLVHVTHGAPGVEGWCELAISGMSFDVTGLAPASGQAMELVETHYGFGSEQAVEDREAVAIAPGPHLASAGGKLPVVRAMCDIAARLCQTLAVQAVGYAPAGTLMTPAYFTDSVGRWLRDGPFPAQGLTSLTLSNDGSVRSRGLAHIIGQELQLQPRPGETADEAVALAARLVDRLVRDGAPQKPMPIDLGEDEVFLEPSRYGKLLLAWRGVMA